MLQQTRRPVLRLTMVVAALAALLGHVPAGDGQTIKVDPTFPRGELKVSVGEPTVMTTRTNVTGVLAVSRTGVVAVFYQNDESGEVSNVYRTSSDAGETWGEQLRFLVERAGLAMFGALREGGVLKMAGQAVPLDKPESDKPGPQRILFSDDFMQYKSDPAKVDLSTFPSNASKNTPKGSFYPPL